LFDSLNSTYYKACFISDYCLIVFIFYSFINNEKAVFLAAVLIKWKAAKYIIIGFYYGSFNSSFVIIRKIIIATVFVTAIAVVAAVVIAIFFIEARTLILITVVLKVIKFVKGNSTLATEFRILLLIRNIKSCNISVLITFDKRI
jgi:hypothetical protein